MDITIAHLLRPKAAAMSPSNSSANMSKLLLICESDSF
jgi:hypothetical protein